jgi:hypothetical protein
MEYCIPALELGVDMMSFEGKDGLRFSSTRSVRSASQTHFQAMTLTRSSQTSF